MTTKTTVKIVCPECGKAQNAKVEDTIPFPTYIHECEKCEYIIMESEWQRVDSNNEKINYGRKAPRNIKRLCRRY